jgi:hypothetical protein
MLIPRVLLNLNGKHLNDLKIHVCEIITVGTKRQGNMRTLRHRKCKCLIHVLLCGHPHVALQGTKNAIAQNPTNFDKTGNQNGCGKKIKRLVAKKNRTTNKVENPNRRG